MRRTTPARRSAAFAAALCAGLAAPGAARAEVTLADDLDLGVPIRPQSTARLSTGGSVDVRLGYRLRVPYRLVSITPELAAGWTELSAHIVRVQPGLRIAYGQIVSPYVFGHVGWGSASFDPARAMSPVSRSVSAVSLDVGGGLDVEITRRLVAGVHMGFDVLGAGAGSATMPGGPLRWASAGLSGTFRF